MGSYSWIARPAAAVIYVPFLQQAFSTVDLSAIDWLVCTVVASSVLWLYELVKLVGLNAPQLQSAGG